MKLIILSINPYKEKDAIIHAISESECIDFLCKGISDPKKGLSALNVPLTEVDVTFLEEDKYKYPVLKEYTLVDPSFNPMNSSNLDEMVSITFIKDATLKLLEEEEQPLMYSKIVKSLSMIKNKVNPRYVALLYLFATLDLAGYGFEVNSCVSCGSRKEIVDFKFEEGGFICRNCMSKLEKSEYSVNQLSSIREIVLNARRYDTLDNVCKYSNGFINTLLTRLIDFTRDALGTNLDHFKLLDI
ncbi:MAG: DNA repair protein RecO [Coprobacillus sp.]|nr:DNA repair protein RecO [Coprobacillus sp.]